MKKQTLLVGFFLFVVIGAVGCSGDSGSNDNSARLPPPANIEGGTKGPQENAAEYHEKRKGLHYQQAHGGDSGEAGGELGDGH